MMIVYGSEDIGITKIDGNIQNWISRVNGILNANTSIEIINEAGHGFSGYENELSRILGHYLLSK